MKGQISKIDLDVADPGPGAFPQNTRKSRNQPPILAVLFAFCSPTNPLLYRTGDTRKCKLLLHLGNSVSFFVDNEDTLPYDFSCQHSR